LPSPGKVSVLAEVAVDVEVGVDGDDRLSDLLAVGQLSGVAQSADTRPAA
jgi:hypothetical protein